MLLSKEMINGYFGEKWDHKVPKEAGKEFDPQTLGG